MQLCVGCVVSRRLFISLPRDEKIDGNNMRGITVVEGKFEKKNHRKVCVTGLYGKSLIKTFIKCKLHARWGLWYPTLTSSSESPLLQHCHHPQTLCIEVQRQLQTYDG